MDNIVNFSDVSNFEKFVRTELHEYEEVLRQAFAAGYQDSWNTRNLDEEAEKWSTLKAVFFSSTVLTTIGK